ncbi:unnamed protein product [Phytophthora lilii]|uniref:ubiquitinyl hydrolase 1 n=1 Tax=Phytophthora lilii TaxID=2077276 RepID=A0A9W6TS16_9STRA|nr:unnamed protein product [Phytophthora lilii]
MQSRLAVVRHEHFRSSGSDRHASLLLSFHAAAVAPSLASSPTKTGVAVAAGRKLQRRQLRRPISRTGSTADSSHRLAETPHYPPTTRRADTAVLAMVEKRRSSADASPPAAQRRKTLHTRTDGDAAPTDDAQAPAPAPGPAQSPPINSPAELPALIFRAQFSVLDFSHERVATDSQQDALGASWRVLWQPRSPTDTSSVGVFVELVSDDLHTARLADVAIVLLNQGGQPPLIKTTSVHAFSRDNPEFGMSQFALRSDLINPSNKFLTQEGKAEIEVRLSFVDEPSELDTGLLEEEVHAALPANQDAAGLEQDSNATLETTQHLLSYDSKEETGMVGLKNQGATCYLNSLLQTLFHLRAFRQVVYETPTTQEDTNDSVSLALQRVFYRLQRQRKAVSTKELTRSFGWSQIDSFMQHDVQELYRILCDRLEEKMKHTRVDSAIPKLFEGRVRSFVQCVDVDFQSSRDESFYDLQLDVKGCKDLMQSFRKYVEVEMLDGDNQYEAEGHGKQDAKKGIKFLTFPPVLNIQLKRFEYDPMRDGMVKIHDRFEFSKTLVLDEFISDDGEKKTGEKKNTGSRYTYHLHSVLVHSGDVHGGHYYVFIRPGKHIATSSDWFRFDDDQITRVDEQVAIEGNFGSAGTPVTPQGGSTEPPSPLYSSSLFSSPDRGGNSNEPSNMDGLEFRSVDAGGEPNADGDHAVDEVYDYSQNNGNGSLSLGSNASNSLMLPLGRNFSSAYMLVYVRDGENDISAIQNDAFSASAAEITPATSSASEDISMVDGDTANNTSTAETALPSWQSDPPTIPAELVARFHEEEKAAARRKKAQQTEHLYVHLRIASDTSVAKLKKITKTMDFSGFNNANTLRIRIKRAASIRQLYRRVYRETGVPMSRQRLWKVITRENRTTRPDQPVGLDAYGCRVESLIEDDASPKTPVKLFLQILNDPLEPLSQAATSPLMSPSSPSIHSHVIGKTKKRSATAIHRHFWDEFTPPELENDANSETESKPSQEMGDEDEDAAAAFAEASESIVVDHAPPIHSYEILLFVKFYDLSRKLGDRLEYKGNIVVDSRLTGAELAKCLHEALSIPYTTELKLYEEVQPVTVSEIDLGSTLMESEIQHGDIICYQYAEDKEKANGIVLDTDLAVEDDPDATEATYIGPDGEEVKAVIFPASDENVLDDSSHADVSALSANGSRSPHNNGPSGAGQLLMGKLSQRQKRSAERYPDVPSYFQYLLDRVEVTFYEYFHRFDVEPFTLPLLNSNVYDEVIDAVAAHLGLVGPKKLYIRLYQHSPLNNAPMKAPLRHSRYSGDDQTTLEDLLTEYMDRTNILHYELLDHPITEIEVKKQLIVHLSIYDACFATDQTVSPPRRTIEVLVMPTQKICDLLQLLREGFGLPEDTPLRACEVVQHGSIITRVLKADTPLSRYYEHFVEGDNTPMIMVEQIPPYEMSTVAKKPSDSPEQQQQAEGASPSEHSDSPVWFYKGVTHFNFQNNSQKWIHPHGVPCMVRFSERDTVGEVKERIRQR